MSVLTRIRFFCCCKYLTGRYSKTTNSNNRYLISACPEFHRCCYSLNYTRAAADFSYHVSTSAHHHHHQNTQQRLSLSRSPTRRASLFGVIVSAAKMRLGALRQTVCVRCVRCTPNTPMNASHTRSSKHTHTHGEPARLSVLCANTLRAVQKPSFFSSVSRSHRGGRVPRQCVCVRVSVYMSFIATIVRE